MDALSEFKIPIRGLSDEIHHYTFLVQDAFFKSFENSLVKNGDLDVSLELDKRPSLLILNFTFKGEIENACDRCANWIHVPVGGNREFLVKYSEEENSNEDVWYISPLDPELNIADMVYELIHLNLPLVNRRPCEEEGHIYCNQEVLKKLEGEASEETKTNPIWDALKDINIED